jgi:hypothetical protein
MKFLSLASAVASLAVSVVGSPATVEAPITYDGYKVYRINTNGQTPAVVKALEGLTYDEWESDGNTLDIALSPDQVSKFTGLGLDFRTLHDNLGSSIVAESKPAASAKWKRQAEDLSWFDSYHTYGDHIRYAYHPALSPSKMFRPAYWLTILVQIF